MEKDRVMLAEIENRYDTFIQSEEVRNYLTTRDFQNKFTKAKQEGKKVKFLADEEDFMSDYFSATDDRRDLIRLFFGRLFSQDNLTSATSSEPVSLLGGDKISLITTELNSGI